MGLIPGQRVKSEPRRTGPQERPQPLWVKSDGKTNIRPRRTSFGAELKQGKSREPDEPSTHGIHAGTRLGGIRDPIVPELATGLTLIVILAKVLLTSIPKPAVEREFLRHGVQQARIDGGPVALLEIQPIAVS